MTSRDRWSVAMDIPLRIVARKTPLSAACVVMVQGEVEALRLFFPRILSCDVHVEGPGHHHRQGVFQVRMIVGVAGRDIIVSRQKSDTLREALVMAFRAAGRRLKNQAKLIRRDVQSGTRNPELP
jgi:hypothetical protein